MSAIEIGELKAVGVEGQRVRPRGQQLANPDGKRRIRATDERNLLPGDFVAMAVRAVKDPGAPQIAEAGNCRELVREPRRDENVAGLENLAAGKFYLPWPVLGIPGEFLHRALGNGSAEFLDLRVTALKQFGGSRAIEAKDAVGMVTEAIAGSPGID